MAKRGPGRPFKPKLGPKLDPQGTLNFIPHDVFENAVIKELLSYDEFETFKNLPQAIKDDYIGTLQTALFKISSKTRANTLLNYGESEFGDLAGVQVTLSLNPQDWKDPELYLKKTVNNWFKNLINRNDIERETEKKIIRGILMGGNGSKNLGGVQLVEDMISTGAGVAGITRTLRGAGGIRGKRMYKDFSDQIMGVVETSQNISLRDASLLSARQNFFDNITREVYGNVPTVSGAAPKNFITNSFADSASFEDLSNAQLAEITQTANGIEAAIGRLPAGPKKDALEKLFVEATRKKDFSDLINKGFITGKNGVSYSLQDLASMRSTTLRGGVTPPFKFTNSFASNQLLNKFGTLDPSYLSDFRSFLEANYDQFGFSSPAAVTALVKFAGDRSVIPDAIGKKLDLAIYGIDKASKGPVAAGIAKVQDAYILKGIYSKLGDQIDDAKRALIENQVALFGSNPNTFIDAVRDLIPDADVAAIESMTKILYYADVRSRSLALEEFLKAVKDKNIVKIYFFMGKYNNLLPKEIQNIKKKIDALKIPLPVLNKYNVGDVSTYLSSIKNHVAYKIGLANYEGHKVYASAKGLNLLTALSPNNTWMYGQDFIRDTDYMSRLAGGMKLELFPGSTFDNYAVISKNFSSSGIFRNLKPANLQLFARDFDGLNNVWEACESLANIYQTNINEMHVIFSSFYDIWETTGNFDFLTNPVYFTGLTPDQIAVYQKSFGNIFKKLQQLNRSAGVDKKDFFSLVTYLAEKKSFIIKDAVSGKYMMARYLPILNQISDQLSALQTYALNFLDSKILSNTLFKFIPPTQKVYTAFFRPGVGAYDRAMNIAKFLGDFANKTGLKALFSKMMAGPGGQLIRFLGARLLPSFLTASSFATLGMTYLMYAVGRFGSALLEGLLQSLRGNYQALYYAFIAALNDIIVVPIMYFVRILKWVGLILVVVIGGAIFFILVIVMGGTFGNYNRPISADIVTDEYGNIYNTILVNGQKCVSLTSETADPGFISNMKGLPIDSGAITDCIHWRGDYFHNGIDIGAGIGTPIKSPYNGDAQVISVYSVNPYLCPGFVGSTCNGGYGNMVLLKIVSGGKEHYLRYAHLDSVSVRVGDIVHYGDQLGLSDHTGNSSGPHLHFEILVGSLSNAAIINPCTIINCGAYPGPVSCSNVSDNLICKN